MHVGWWVVVGGCVVVGHPCVLFVVRFFFEELARAAAAGVIFVPQ